MDSEKNIIKDIETLKNKIRKVINETHSVQMYLMLKQGDEISLRLADTENKTQPELSKLFCDYLNQELLKKEDVTLYELSVSEERDGAVYHYDYEDYPEELKKIKDFDIRVALKEIPKFNFIEEDLKDLYGYIIYIGSMQDGVVLFKKYYPISLLKRGSFLLGAKKAENRFEKMAEEDIIRFNGVVEIIKINDEIFVLNVQVLERNMGFAKLIFKAADESIQAIEDLNLLEDIEVLKDAAADVSFARKLSKVKNASPIFKLKIPKETIIEFAKTTKELSGKFKFSEDEKSIRLDTKKSKDAFIMLMNDSFLRSELTAQFYEARLKDTIQVE